MPISEGRVLRAQSGRYRVLTREGEVKDCRARKRLNRPDSSWPVFPVPGDLVEWREGNGGAVIVAVRPRQSEIARQRSGSKHVVLANLDQIIAVIAVREPNLNRGMLDRLLATAERNELASTIVFNKMDLAEEGEFDTVRGIYESIGYPVLMTSAESGEGIEDLKRALSGHISAFLGPSGAGKSALITRLQPDLELRTGDVSEKSGQGRHTTTRVDLHLTDFSALLADTPGFREFNLWAMDPTELADLFVEFRSHAAGCRFASCTHDHEPQCGVKQAIDSGDVDVGRYKSYLATLAELQNESTQRAHKGRRRMEER